MRISLQQVLRRHHLPGDAEAALHGPGRDKRILQTVQTAVLCQSLDCRDGAAIDFNREHEAGIDGTFVHQDRARATLTHLAALLGPGQVQLVAEQVEQRGTGRHLE
jgi:hypothetical protein